MKTSSSATLVALSLLVLAGLLAAGCTTTSDTAEETTLTVFTAASLTGAFTDIGKAYEAENENVKVDFAFDGSQALRTQIEQGANPDIFVSASTKHMKALQDGGFMDNGTVTPFLENNLALIVPVDNPAGVIGLADLNRLGVKLVIGTRDVPFGDYTRQMLEKLAADPAYGPVYRDAVMANVISEETAVSSVVPKLALGEADAAIVYKSDVSRDDLDRVTRIEIPAGYNVKATYPLGILTESPNRAEAESFIAFVRGPDGSAILTEYGFDPIPA
ncbi:molybdate ABC transporter substrate-binding protein [Methanoculleus sp.]|uniref:molybdate ABC transporter substrate-binding protein n=1 Tax=Methanoculleus sp. TaxID=90427 RepID=UPI0025E3D4BF|nr:molybdate ABC transporter substrate-binding protein [Methanoculleus sp.]